jgi:hypothetical protein
MFAVNYLCELFEGDGFHYRSQRIIRIERALGKEGKLSRRNIPIEEE